jgi:hypothetical protein
MIFIYVVVLGAIAFVVWRVVKHLVPARHVWLRRVVFVVTWLVVVNTLGALLRPILVGMALQDVPRTLTVTPEEESLAHDVDDLLAPVRKR